jgi:hypothetical protein
MRAPWPVDLFFGVGLGFAIHRNRVFRCWFFWRCEALSPF